MDELAGHLGELAHPAAARWAPAIFALAGATLDRVGPSAPIGVCALAGWVLASFWIPVLAGEIHYAFRPRH